MPRNKDGRPRRGFFVAAELVRDGMLKLDEETHMRQKYSKDWRADHKLEIGQFTSFTKWRQANQQMEDKEVFVTSAGSLCDKWKMSLKELCAKSFKLA